MVHLIDKKKIQSIEKIVKFQAHEEVSAAFYQVLNTRCSSYPISCTEEEVIQRTPFFYLVNF